jgi:hypothetical protein
MELAPEQIRVIGSLMEKAVTTPDQIPLTLNALLAACNQKSSREPVMGLERGALARVADRLAEDGLVVREENFKSGVVKYRQRFCNTPFSDWQFTEDEYAVVCVLMLRGAQTPGELRTRCNRLHEFRDNEAVGETLDGLMDPDREGGPVVARLPRVAGRRDHQYAHQFSGAVESVAAADAVVASAPRRSSALAELEARVSALESELADLKQRLRAE